MLCVSDEAAKATIVVSLILGLLPCEVDVACVVVEINVEAVEEVVLEGWLEVEEEDVIEVLVEVTVKPVAEIVEACVVDVVLAPLATTSGY